MDSLLVREGVPSDGPVSLRMSPATGEVKSVFTVDNIDKKLLDASAISLARVKRRF